MNFSGTIERIVAGRWVAGPNLPDSIIVAKRLNKARLSVIINYLGEEITFLPDFASSAAYLFSIPFSMPY